jgi:N-methylhydantoinase B
VELRVDGKWKTDFPNAKVLVAHLKPGDAFKIRSGGGGGYGNPFERPVAKVLHDVRHGYVTAKAAAELYGVVIDAETFVVDEAATAKLRASLDAISRITRIRG